eukprot:5393140-Lingulodinium_polyedra.AAC.1
MGRAEKGLLRNSHAVPRACNKRGFSNTDMDNSVRACVHEQNGQWARCSGGFSTHDMQRLITRLRA